MSNTQTPDPQDPDDPAHVDFHFLATDTPPTPEQNEALMDLLQTLADIALGNDNGKDEGLIC